MNKDEIKKALECCISNEYGMCKHCPNYNHKHEDCIEDLKRQELALITEQEKKIEDLEYEIFYLERKIAIRDNALNDRDKEIERLEGNQDDIVNYARIDVLNELKKRITKDRVANDNVVINANYEIDKMIKEIKK